MLFRVKKDHPASSSPDVSCPKENVESELNGKLLIFGSASKCCSSVKGLGSRVDNV